MQMMQFREIESKTADFHTLDMRQILTGEDNAASIYSFCIAKLANTSNWL